MMSELLHVCFNVISTGKAHMFIVWKFLEISLIKLSRPTGNVDCPEMLLAGVQCGLKPTRNFGFWLTRFPPGPGCKLCPPTLLLAHPNLKI